MSSSFAESHVEDAALAWLSELGYAPANGPDIGPDGSKPERASYGDVLLVERLRVAITRLNPSLNAETRTEALSKLTQLPLVQLIEDQGAPYDFVARQDRRTYADLITPSGLAEIATYAQAIGPNKSLVIPAPVSVIRSSTLSSRRRTSTVIRPPAGVNLIALERRFQTTC